MAIQSHLADIATLFTCNAGVPGQLSEQYTRIQTPFTFPDGDVFDIFFRKEAGTSLLSDLGETLRWFKDQWIEEALPEPLQDCLSEICQTHGVMLSAGQLCIRIKQESGIAEAIVRIAQASLSITALWFVLRNFPRLYDGAPCAKWEPE